MKAAAVAPVGELLSEGEADPTLLEKVNNTSLKKHRPGRFAKFGKEVDFYLNGRPNEFGTDEVLARHRLSEVTIHRISSSLSEEYSALNNSCLKKHRKSGNHSDLAMR